MSSTNQRGSHRKVNMYITCTFIFFFSTLNFSIKSEQGRFTDCLPVPALEARYFVVHTTEYAPRIETSRLFGALHRHHKFHFASKKTILRRNSGTTSPVFRTPSLAITPPPHYCQQQSCEGMVFHRTPPRFPTRNGPSKLK